MQYMSIKIEDTLPLDAQVLILADFLLDNFPEEIGKGSSEGAIEMAIRLLEKQKL